MKDPSSAIASAIEWQHLSPSKQPCPSLPSTISWLPPKPGLFKLNTDGASKNNPGLAAADGIIRDWTGKWISDFCRNIGHSSSIEAELWAMRDGLKLALDLNLTGIEVETDATIMQNIILGNFNHCHQLSNLIHDCRYLLDRLGTSTISHTYWEGNKCADLLANEGSNHEEMRETIEEEQRYVVVC
ncbi:unnamed protein product [Camellia sinensis]